MSAQDIWHDNFTSATLTPTSTQSCRHLLLSSQDIYSVSHLQRSHFCFTLFVNILLVMWNTYFTVLMKCPHSLASPFTRHSRSVQKMFTVYKCTRDGKVELLKLCTCNPYFDLTSRCRAREISELKVSSRKNSIAMIFDWQTRAAHLARNVAFVMLISERFGDNGPQAHSGVSSALVQNS